MSKYNALSKYGKLWFVSNGTFAIIMILGTMIEVRWAKNVLVFWIILSMISKIIVSTAISMQRTDIKVPAYKNLDKFRPIGDNPTYLFDFIMLSILIGTGCWIVFILYLIDTISEYNIIMRLRLDKIKGEVLEKNDEDFKENLEATKNNIEEVRKALIRQKENLKPSMN